MNLGLIKFEIKQNDKTLVHLDLTEPILGTAGLRKVLAELIEMIDAPEVEDKDLV
jgi:hypothetical protein